MIRLKELREEIGYSQTQVANAIKTNQRNIGRWENGENEPTSSFIVKLADFFNVSADFILGREDDLGNKISTPFSTMDKETQKLLKIFEILNQRQKERLLAYAEGMLEAEKEYKNRSPI